MQRLTDLRARQAKPDEVPYKLTDGHGLVLLIKPNGKKAWRYRYRIGGKENMFAIGEYPAVNLRDARAARDRARALVEQGIHPAQQRKADRLVRAIATAQTFESVATAWIEQNRKKWSRYYCGQVETVLRQDVFPAIGGLPIGAVKSPHLYSIVTRVAGRGAETVAILIRQWCSAIFRNAAAAGLVEFDPTTALKRTIVRDEVRHKRPMSRSDIVEFCRRLGRAEGTPEVRIALKLLLLTFVRPGELRGAKWSEFDLDNAEWLIPADRMKMREEHTVPLSAQALQCLGDLQKLSKGRSHLFPNIRDPKRVMSPTTLNRRLERMGYGNRFSAHGFRATASTILNERNFSADVIERQLAHAERNKVRAVYNQAQYLDERRRMMQAWADFIDGLITDQGKVTQLRRRVA